MRTPATILVLIATAALISACGSSAPAGTGGGSGSGAGTATRHNLTATADEAVRFARCMRRNGVGQFPDPPASGSFTLDGIANGSSLNTNTPVFAQALGICKRLEPAGFAGGRRTSQQMQAALEFARCVREHGVRDFPDPVQGQPLVNTNRIPSSGRPGGMSALNQAMHECGTYAAKAIGRLP